MESMELTSVTRDGITVLGVRGEIDIQDAEQLKSAMDAILLRDASPRAILDVSGISRMNSYAVALIGCFNSQFHHSKGQLILVGAGGPAKRALELSGLDRVVTVASTVEEAQRLFSA